MEEKIIEIKEILLKLDNLSKEISYLDTMIAKYDRETDKIEEKIDNYTFNIKDRINYLYREKEIIRDKIKNLEEFKKKLKLKIFITILNIMCLGTALILGNNVSKIIFLVTSISGISLIVTNIISNKKLQEELNSYNIKEIDSSIEKEKNNLNKKYNKNLKPYLERKDEVFNEESILRSARIEKKKEFLHLKSEKDKKYKELLEIMEEEVKHSNSEIDGQLEISGMRRVKSR